MTAVDVAIERLEDVSAVTALVGDRIYASHLPQGVTYPALLVRFVGEGVDQHLRGRNGLQRDRVQVDAYALETSGSDPYGQANAVAEAVRGNGLGTTATGLFGWIGTVGGSPPTARVRNVELLGRFEDYDPAEQRLVRVSRDYRVHWEAIE